MNDWGMSVLSQYPVTVRTTRKVRGALLCDTKEGLYLLSEYRGKQARLEAEAALLLYLAENGMVHTDQIIKNEKEELLSKNEEGTGYVLKMWYPWPECSVSSIGDLVQAVNSLARLHVSMRRMPKHLLIKQEKVQSEESKQDMTEGNAVTNTHKERQSLACQYEKHNRELRRVRAYLHRKKKKSVLEQFIQKSLDEMYNQADIAVRAMMDGGLYEVEEQAKKEGHLIHGAYHQHNVLIGQGQTAAVNFEQFRVGCQICDLYQFIRKIMEKHNWNQELGMRLIREYNRVQNMSQKEISLLGFMIAYPEKYWKQVNFYFNNSKSWISEKNIEKIKKAVEQNSVRTAFADCLLQKQLYKLIIGQTCGNTEEFHNYQAMFFLRQWLPLNSDMYRRCLHSQLH